MPSVSSTRPFVAALTLALATAGCPGSPAPVAVDGDSGTAHLTMVSGNGQVGIVNRPLPNPYVVRLMDSLGQPLVGAAVRGRAIGKWAGTVDSLVLTDTQGFASLQRVLGEQAGMQTTWVRSRLAPKDTLVFSDSAAGLIAIRRP